MQQQRTHRHRRERASEMAREIPQHWGWEINTSQPGTYRKNNKKQETLGPVSPRCRRREEGNGQMLCGVRRNVAKPGPGQVKCVINVPVIGNTATNVLHRMKMLLPQVNVEKVYRRIHLIEIMYQPRCTVVECGKAAHKAVGSTTYTTHVYSHIECAAQGDSY